MGLHQANGVLNHSLIVSDHIVESRECPTTWNKSKLTQFTEVLSLKKSTLRGTFPGVGLKRIQAVFYSTEAGDEPVRVWIKAMAPDDRHLIGHDIKTVEFGWPVGMPLCRSMGDGLHEVRTELPGNRVARVFFYLDQKQRMVLLHGILKKTRTAPRSDLDLARQNKRKHERAQK